MIICTDWQSKFWAETFAFKWILTELFLSTRFHIKRITNGSDRRARGAQIEAELRKSRSTWCVSAALCSSATPSSPFLSFSANKVSLSPPTCLISASHESTMRVFMSPLSLCDLTAFFFPLPLHFLLTSSHPHASSCQSQSCAKQDNTVNFAYDRRAEPSSSRLIGKCSKASQSSCYPNCALFFFFLNSHTMAPLSKVPVMMRWAVPWCWKSSTLWPTSPLLFAMESSSSLTGQRKTSCR